MIKYPEYIEAGASVKSLISIARGGGFVPKQHTKDAWIVGGYALSLTLGEPDAATPPGTLRMALAPESEPTFDEACETLTNYFDPNPEMRSGKPMSFIVSALLVVLQNSLKNVNPALAAGIMAAIQAIIEAAGK